MTRARVSQRDSALYFDEMGTAKVPAGFGRDGQPVYIHFEFVDGTRGAHVSISGVSGIATKTSFALFLLHAITNCGVLTGEAPSRSEHAPGARCADASDHGARTRRRAGRASGMTWRRWTLRSDDGPQRFRQWGSRVFRDRYVSGPSRGEDLAVEPDREGHRDGGAARGGGLYLDLQQIIESGSPPMLAGAGDDHEVDAARAQARVTSQMHTEPVQEGILEVLVVTTGVHDSLGVAMAGTHAQQAP